MEQRPKLDLETDPTDQMLYFACHIGVAVLFLLALIYFFRLPDTIPIHFDAAGRPDGYGSKWFIWLLPLIGGGMHWLLFAIRKIPHQFNYTVPITEENAEAQYRNAQRLLALLDLVIMFIFVYLQWGMIQTALGNAFGLGAFAFLFIMGGIFTPVIYFLIQSNKLA